MNMAPLQIRTVLSKWELHMPLGLIFLSLIEIGIKWQVELGVSDTHPQYLALIKAKTSSLSDLARRHVQTDIFPHWPMGFPYTNTPLPKSM